MKRSTGSADLDPRTERRTLVQRLAATAAIAVFVALSLLLGALEPIEHRLTVVRAELLHRPPTGQVAIVAIDAKSLAEISTWPWSRRYHAVALDRLDAAGAELVAFDVDFSSKSEAAGDKAFAEALRRAPATILPIFQQRASDDPSEERVLSSAPAPIFQSAWVGGVNIFPGADGVVREYPAATMIDGQIHPSIATLLAENDDLGDRYFQPDWAIDVQQIPRFSFADIIQSRVPRKELEGKRIIVGATAIELGDRYPVPRFGTVPGVVIQAAAAESLLQGRAITRSGVLSSLVGVLIVALALGAARFRRFNRSFPLAAAGVLILLAAGPLAIQARWPLSVDSAAMLFCAIGCVTMRVALEVRRRVRLSALLDPESGLGNGLALEEALVALDERGAVLVAAAIDRFEQIRSAVGPEALTELIRETSARIGEIIGRPVYRIEPDTLAWLDLERCDEWSAIAVTQGFREAVQTREGAIDVQLAIGLDCEPVGRNARSKIERALSAISMARAAGESHHWYQANDPAVRRQLSMMSELRRGIANGEVAVAYQPKLDLRTGKITQAEALVRWQHPQYGFIPPDQFIPLAESTGVIRELTHFVLRQAVADLASRQPTAVPLSLAVNVSAADLGDAGFVDKVSDVLGSSNIHSGRIALEITESAIISSPEAAISVLTALRERGIQLAVDDYGTGQSTLTYLKRLPVHELKIDKSFVTSICDNENDRIMVRSTIDLAHELGLRVVAEGVEDQPTLNLLRALGCDFAQGYFIGKAMPFEELCRLAEGDGVGRKVA